MRNLLVLSIVVLSLSGCTDAEMSDLTTLGAKANITCYSGTLVIYQGISSGKVSSIQNSDGWFWVDASTGRNVTASGTCIFKY